MMTSALTAVDAVGQLADIASGFLAVTKDVSPVTTDHEQLGDSPVLIQLAKARAAASTRVTQAYATDFPTTPLPPMQVDNGVVLSYASDPGSGMGEIINQLKVQFTNWNLIINEAQAEQLAKTLAVETNAQLGGVGTTGGSYGIDSNTICQWTLAYGLFTQNDAGDQALVYAFAADETS